MVEEILFHLAATQGRLWSKREQKESAEHKRVELSFTMNKLGECEKKLKIDEYA